MKKLVKVKNITGEDPRFPIKKDLGFRDDKGIRHDIKAGEEVECPYKRSMDHRLVIQSETKKKKELKKEVK